MAAGLKEKVKEAISKMRSEIKDECRRQATSFVEKNAGGKFDGLSKLLGASRSEGVETTSSIKGASSYLERIRAVEGVKGCQDDKKEQASVTNDESDEDEHVSQKGRHTFSVRST